MRESAQRFTGSTTVVLSRSTLAGYWPGTVTATVAVTVAAQAAVADGEIVSLRLFL